jgi:hypothetical protein
MLAAVEDMVWYVIPYRFTMAYTSETVLEL